MQDLEQEPERNPQPLALKWHDFCAADCAVAHQEVIMDAMLR